MLFGAELERLDDEGHTALMTAVRFEKVETVQLLLELNADTTKTDYKGWGISQTRNEEIKELLLEHFNKEIRVVCFVCFDFGC